MNRMSQLKMMFTLLLSIAAILSMAPAPPPGCKYRCRNLDPAKSQRYFPDAASYYPGIKHDH